MSRRVVLAAVVALVLAALAAASGAARIPHFVNSGYVTGQTAYGGTLDLYWNRRKHEVTGLIVGLECNGRDYTVGYPTLHRVGRFQNYGYQFRFTVRHAAETLRTHRRAFTATVRVTGAIIRVGHGVEDAEGLGTVRVTGPGCLAARPLSWSARGSISD